MELSNKSDLNKTIVANLRELSNFDQVTSVLQRNVDYGEIWFRCGKCKEMRAPEQMYFTQEDEPDLLLQNFSTFFSINEKKDDISGIDEDFDENRPIAVICGDCLKKFGVQLDSIPVVAIDTKENKLV